MLESFSYRQYRHYKAADQENSREDLYDLAPVLPADAVCFAKCLFHAYFGSLRMSPLH